MAVTRDEAYDALASLHPAPVFLESYRATRLPDNLDLYFRPPEEFFLGPESQAAYTGGSLIPILDDGSFRLVTFLDPASGGLIQQDVEAPGGVVAAYRHWQQYLAAVMLSVGETVDDDDRVRRIAAAIGFGFTRELFEHFDRVQSLSREAWAEARRRFPLDVPIRPD